MGPGTNDVYEDLIVVDHDVNVHDLSEVTWVAGNHIDPKRDTVFVEGPVDMLDHAAPILGYGSKIGIDATRKWRSEGFEREWPEPRATENLIKSKNTLTPFGRKSAYECGSRSPQSRIQNLKSKIADYGESRPVLAHRLRAAVRPVLCGFGMAETSGHTSRPCFGFW